MLACLTLVLVFKESSKLAAAYGFAVTATMTITSLLYFQVTRFKWKWPLWQSILLLVLFLFFDSSFLGANLLKVVDGGWITICIAAVISTSMITWRDGRALLAKHYSLMRMPTDVFLEDLAEYSPSTDLRHGCLHVHLPRRHPPHPAASPQTQRGPARTGDCMLSVLSAETPKVSLEDRVNIDDLGQGFYRVNASYGFMETPNMPEIHNPAQQKRPAGGYLLDLILPGPRNNVRHRDGPHGPVA